MKIMKKVDNPKSP